MATFEVTKNDYYNRNQPSRPEELANVVELKMMPLRLATTIDEVFRSRDAITLDPGAVFTVEAQYSKVPVSEAVASLVDLTLSGPEITAASYYAWGAKITITNKSLTNISTFKVKVDGYPLVVQGETILWVSDEQSIKEHGVQRYTFPDNHLVQDNTVGYAIVNAILASYKQLKKDVSVDWRGNPALSLDDEIEVPEYQKNDLSILGIFRVFRNKLSYDGTLRSVTEGRKI
jgi:hypothetical protein